MVGDLKMLKEKLAGKPWITYSLIAVNIVVYLLMTVVGGSESVNVLLAFGAKFNPLIALGQWWRLFTPMFLHIGIEHLILNMVTLYFIGMQIEMLFGPTRYLLLYLLSGIGGNLASFAFNPGISAGASTALFGLFGAFFMLAENFKNNPYLRAYAKQFLLLIILNVAFSFVGNADLSGHLGGLFAGFLLAYIVGLPRKGMIERHKRILALIALVIIYILMWNIGLKNL